MPQRKVPLAIGEIYHIYNKSIAEFKIFNCYTDYERIIDAIRFYSIDSPPCRFDVFRGFNEKSNASEIFGIDTPKKIVDIIAYCIMSTHFHFILKELKDGGISKFITSISKSYSQYFNIKHNRKGPLWENRFKNVLIKGDSQLIHLTRYIHLNPVTAFLINNPIHWRFSSYREYLGLIAQSKILCNFSDYLKVDMKDYERFVNDHIDYQRELALIKSLILE